MKRITALVVFFCLLALFSCKKDAVTPVTNDSKSKSAESLALITVNGVQVQSDTIPPSNAVNVKTYGATGNGYTDDTKAIQNAINAQNVVVLNGGTYIINQTLNLRSGVTIYGINGATIKSGTAMSGSLLTCGRYIYVNSGYGGAVVNLNFAPSSQPFSLGVWSTSCIYILNSQSVAVKYNRFNFNQPYQATGIEGVWVSGGLSKGTYIGHNTFNTVGIEYAEGGACGTITTSNVVNNSHSNAISGHGNGTTYSTGNQVLNNIVNNAGYNGINDWGAMMDGTLIKANTINGSGKSPSQGAQGEGIQSVGTNTTVSFNTIKDAQAEYIEVRSTDQKIDSNTIVDTKGIMQGIVINCMSAAPTNARSATTIINHNTITGCTAAIVVIGNYSPSVSIINNSLINPVSTGINVNSNASSYKVNASNNSISITTPNKGNRKAITSYAGTRTSSQLFTISGNTVNYSSTAAGGTGGEYAMLPCTNNAVVTGNQVSGNNIKMSNGSYITAITSNGVTYTGYTITNNTFTGSAKYDLSGFVSAIMSGNIL